MATYGFTVNCDGNAVEQLKKINAALNEAGVNAKVQVGEIENSLSGMGERLSGIFSNLKSLMVGGILGAGVFGGFEFIKDSKEVYNDLQKSVARVNAELVSTHYAAGLSGSAITDQAEAMDKHIAASRAQILEASGMQLSFTNIKGPMFGEAMKSIADFATFYKEDMNSAALQVDKALNDPALGFRRLIREGVTFTEEQQKQIKNYEKQGKLAEAQEVILKELRREFGGQSEAFANTDQGKIQMDEKQWEELKLHIGEIISKTQLSLLPVFEQIRDYTKEAFDSAPMQFFINHIKDLLSIGMKLIPIWGTYKGLQAANALLTAEWTISTKGLTIAMEGETAATGEATAAVEAFGIAWSSVGIGAIAVTLGLVVEKLISMNEELDKSIDKKYKLSESNDFFKSSSDKFESIKERMQIFQKLSKSQQSELAGDVRDYVNSTREKYPVLQQRRLNLDAGKAVGANNYGTNDMIADFMATGGMPMDFLHSQGYQENSKTIQAFSEMSKNMKNLDNHFIDAKGYLKTLADNKIKPIAGYTAPGSGLTGQAYATSQLAGARGGLGEAKVINIHIDTVQKNIGVTGEGVANNADKAIQYLLRAVNNLSASQSSTM